METGAKPSVQFIAFQESIKGLHREAAGRIQGKEGMQVLTEHHPKVLLELGMQQGWF